MARVERNDRGGNRQSIQKVRLVFAKEASSYRAVRRQRATFGHLTRQVILNVSVSFPLVVKRRVRTSNQSPWAPANAQKCLRADNKLSLNERQLSDGYAV